MHWRSNPKLPEKIDRADLLTLSLMALLIRGGEQVALLGEGVRPASGRLALARLADAIGRDSTPPLPGAREGRSLPPEMALPRHAQVVLIGDFLSPLPEISASIRSIAASGVGGFVVQLLDPAEETLPFTGRTRFEGMEHDGEMLIPRVEAIRDDYHAALSAHIAGLGDIARQVGWTFLSHRTDRSPESALLSLFVAMSKEGYR
jgi:uncharacterized protein (DUF58 family)